jgi:hypothetical protein
MNLYNKVICPQTNTYHEDFVQISDSNEIEKSEYIQNIECPLCMKLVISSYNKNTDHHDELCQYTTLPLKTYFFHLNNNVLYNDQRFGNPDFYKDKTVLLVGTGALKRKSVLDSLKKLNFKKKINLIINQSWTLEYFDDFIVAETDNVEKKEETLTVIKNYMHLNNIKFDAIFTYDEFCVLMTAYLTQELNLPGIPYDVACKIRNKHEFRKYSEQLGVNYPNYHLVESSERISQVRKIESLLNGKLINDREKSRLLQDLAKIEPPFIVKNKFGLGKGKYDWHGLKMTF